MLYICDTFFLCEIACSHCVLRVNTLLTFHNGVVVVSKCVILLKGRMHALYL